MGVELDLRHLGVLCAIDDAGSITRAATVVGVSQPALTAQLHRIESSLGLRVFTRTSAGVRVTPAGRRVLGHARTARAAMSRLRGEMRHHDEDAAVRIGGPGPLLLALVEQLSDPARQSYQVTARVDRSSRLLQAELEHDRVDYVILREYPGHEIDVVNEGLGQWTLVDPEPMFLGMPRHHRLAGRPVVALGDLRDELWVVDPDDDTGEVDLLIEACAGEGFEPRIGLITSDSQVARTYVGAGHGIALLDARAPRGEQTVIRPLLGDPVRRRILLRWREAAADLLPPERVRRDLTVAYEDTMLAHPVYRDWVVDSRRSAGRP